MPSILPEEQLILQLQARQASAFHYLYDHYAPALFGEINRRVDDHHQAEDILQEVMISVFHHIHQYDPVRGRLFTWLITTARNKCIDHQRSAAFRRQKCTREVTEEVAVCEDSRQEHLDFAIVRKQIHGAHPKTGKLFELVYVNGFTHEQAAKVCGIPVGTVKTRIRATVRKFQAL